MKKTILSLIALSAAFCLGAQTSPIRFAYLSDVHITFDSQHNVNLEKCVADINSRDDIQFTMFGGDITEFGNDEEIALAKSIIDKLEKPYYIVAGNHDAKWSESGCNTFAKVFGYEQFEFEKEGIKFIGCNSGPNMRMAPALLPHETLVWLDSIARATPPEKPVILVNHFPQDTSMLNYFQVLNAVKQCNVQLIIGGHWHRNTILDYDGVPGVLGRAPDHGKQIGYNIFNIADGKISVSERIIANKDGKPVSIVKEPWFTMEISGKPLYEPDRKALEDNKFGLPENYPFINFSVNGRYPQVKTVWEHQDEGDIGCGAVYAGKYVLYDNTKGVIKALDSSTGEELWRYATEGKTFSTPAVSGRNVVVGSSDGNIYCLNLRNGELRWKYRCNKSVLASPAILDGIAYCGTSDHIFRAIRVKDGKLVWQFDGVKGFVESKPYVDEQQVVFGDWGNTLYSLDPKTGALQWKWTVKGSRMFSPAAVYPVKTGGRIFFVTPERKTYALDARTGKEIWSGKGGRESIALSPDGSKIYVKNMFGRMHAFSTAADECQTVWEAAIPGMGYEIGPTPCACEGDNLFMPTDKGNLFCLDAADGSVKWVHKISVALLNSIVPLPDNKLLISTMDGIVTILQY